MSSRIAQATIDQDALRKNLVRCRALAPGSKVMSVIKSDAYGHGIERVVPALSDVDAFAVATVGELARVRGAGWNGSLVLLQGFSLRAELEQALDLDAEIVIHHECQLQALRKLRPQSPPRFWLLIDTGMHRLGFEPRMAADTYRQLETHAGPRGIGLMSHFACADEPGNPSTAAQREQFLAAVAELEGPRCLANSAGVLGFPESRLEWVRPGLMLYGISPFADSTGEDWGLHPAMKLQSRIIAIYPCRKGDPVGYGAAYRCPEDMPVGVAAIGYGDGYPRCVAPETPVLIDGRLVPQAGRVSMDMITLDLRGREDVSIGDTVTLWGGGLPVERIAAASGTIPYELTCGVSGRIGFQMA